MTRNQIDFARLNEERRTNRAKEAEAARSNLAREQETVRHNVVTEGESARHNVITEGETNRANLASERLKHEANVINRDSAANQLTEVNRHNIATETIQQQDADTRRGQLSLGYDQLKEQIRHNQRNEEYQRDVLGENYRHNTTTELLSGLQLSEMNRHNIASEGVESIKAMASDTQARAASKRADAEQQQQDRLERESAMTLQPKVENMRADTSLKEMQTTVSATQADRNAAETQRTAQSTELDRQRNAREWINTGTNVVDTLSNVINGNGHPLMDAGRRIIQSITLNSIRRGR